MAGGPAAPAGAHAEPIFRRQLLPLESDLSRAADLLNAAGRWQFLRGAAHSSEGGSPRDGGTAGAPSGKRLFSAKRCCPTTTR